MKTTLRFLAGSFALAAILYACKKENKTVPVQLLLTDNPAAFDSVNIHIKSMQVKLSDDTTGWHTLVTKDTTVNLLSLQNGVTMVLAQGDVPQGTLKEVRFILGPGNYVVTGGTRHDLQTPSAESSGLKVKIDKALGASLNTFTLDFDASLSVKEENGQYKLMPVIKMKS